MSKALARRVAQLERRRPPERPTWPTEFVICGADDAEPLLPGDFVIGGPEELHRQQEELNRAHR